MGKKVYTVTALTGSLGDDSLDELDGANLNDGDLAIVTAAGVIYFFELDHDNSSAESSPTIISPNRNYGTKRWVLQGVNSGASTDHAIPRFNGTTGILQNSGVTIDDSNNLILAGDIYSVDWTNYTNDATYIGVDDFSAGYKFFAYKVIGDIVYVNIYFKGHLNAGSAALGVSVPHDIFSDFKAYFPCMVLAGGTWQAGIARCDPSVTTTSFEFGVGFGSTIDNFDSGAGAEKGVHLSTWYRK